MTSEMERFLSKISPPDQAGCWPWIGTISGDGYGAFKRSGRRQVGAHRLAYEMLVGPIPYGMCVCHSCDNPICVNPDHLWIGSVADNHGDKARKGRSARGERQHLNRLSRQQVLEIRDAVANGERVSRIARRFGIGRSTIWNIMMGYSWAWLSREAI